MLPPRYQPADVAACRAHHPGRTRPPAAERRQARRRTVDGLAEDSYALADDVFLAGPDTPPLTAAGRLTAIQLDELRRALAWTFGLDH
jgi:hypothetical protein